MESTTWTMQKKIQEIERHLKSQLSAYDPLWDKKIELLNLHAIHNGCFLFVQMPRYQFHVVPPNYSEEPAKIASNLIDMLTEHCKEPHAAIIDMPNINQNPITIFYNVEGIYYHPEHTNFCIIRFVHKRNPSDIVEWCLKQSTNMYDVLWDLLDQLHMRCSRIYNEIRQQYAKVDQLSLTIKQNKFVPSLEEAVVFNASTGEVIAHTCVNPGFGFCLVDVIQQTNDLIEFDVLLGNRCDGGKVLIQHGSWQFRIENQKVAAYFTEKPVPDWCKAIETCYDLVKNPLNTAMHHILDGHDEPEYVGNALFIDSMGNHYVKMENSWLLVDSLWLHKVAKHYPAIQREMLILQLCKH